MRRAVVSDASGEEEELGFRRRLGYRRRVRSYALLVREDLVVAGSNSVEAGGLRLLAVCPVVVRGHVIHPGIVPWCPGLAADDLDEQIAIADAKSQASACPASVHRSSGRLRRRRSERGEHDNNDDDSNEETCNSKVQKKPECEEDLHVIHVPDNLDRGVRTRDRPKLVLAKPALLRLAFKTAMIRNSCRGKRSVVQTREQRVEPLPR
jgi:hypothetical protein